MIAKGVSRLQEPELEVVGNVVGLSTGANLLLVMLFTLACNIRVLAIPVLCDLLKQVCIGPIIGFAGNSIGMAAKHQSWK